jgi:hypothetical protein
MVTDSMKLTFIKTLKEKDGPVLIADVSELPGVAIRYDARRQIHHRLQWAAK